MTPARALIGGVLAVKGETIDPRIVPGALVTLRQRLRYIPIDVRDHPDFNIEKTSVPIWREDLPGGAGPYESAESGSLVVVIERYVKNDVTKLEVLVDGRAYHCYGTHADLEDLEPAACKPGSSMV